MERPCLVLQNVGTDLLDFDVQEPHNDIDSDDDGEPMKETLVEEAQGEQPEGRLRTQKSFCSSSPSLAIFNDVS